MPAPPRRPTSSVPRRPGRGPPPSVEPEAESAGATARSMETASEDDGENTVPGGEDATVNMASGEGANATVVFDTNKGARKGAAAAPTAKLIVNKGPKQGAEFTLGPGETSVGRNNDNTIVIPDISVSRKHVVLVKQASGYLLQDQGSGNGTLLNGTPVGEQLLKDGDLISIGDTELQFATMGASASPPRRQSSVSNVAARPGRAPSRVGPTARPAPPDVEPHVSQDEEPEHTGQINAAGNKKKKKGPPLGPIVGVMGVLLLLGFGWKYKQNRIAADLAAAAQADIEKQQKDAADVFKQGKDLAQKGDWTNALAKFTTAKANGLEDPELDDYITRSQKELANQKLLTDAQAALDAHTLASAMDSAKKVPPDSLLSDKAEDIKKKILAAIPDRLKTAQGFVDTKQWDDAQKIVDDCKGADPSNAAVLQMNAAIDAGRNHKEPPKLGGHVEAIDPTQNIRTAFNNGDVKGAKDMAAASAGTDDRVKTLLQEITEFEAIQNDPSQSEKARKLDREIGGGHSVFSKTYAVEGFSKYLKNGLEAKSAGNLVKAYQNLNTAHQLDPTNQECSAALGEIKSKAHEIYMDAYTEKADNPEDAKQKFKQVMSMTPPDDENHQKAAKRLEEMGN